LAKENLCACPHKLPLSDHSFSMNFTQALTNFTREQVRVCPGVARPLVSFARGVGYPISYILHPTCTWSLEPAHSQRSGLARETSYNRWTGLL